ncbi:MAG: GNAT family N-acetyltransferase [Bacillus sp. (in: Bacteria)]|nr:GNAT family N-acetyltransferase [Bacillus sp. (in: firmicutes)]MCM1425043.1 GNAT family N-acetyltransferase [Eubacterium sp.]
MIPVQIQEASLNNILLHDLLSLSAEWEREQSCYGYRKNEKSDLKGRRIFTVQNDSEIIGYAFGKVCTAEKDNSIMQHGTTYFELEEIFVQQKFRSLGIGRQLFETIENTLKKESVPYILLSTATKNYKAVMHFYLEEMGMEFWSARLFKRI